jgi:hypothetical protein
MKNANPVVLVILLILVIPGCKSNDDRLVDLAREHAVRQAEAQRQMTDLQKQVTEGSRRLVEADARAREELTVMQHDLRADAAEIGHQRDQMEAERREIATQRHRDPVVAAVILDIGIVLACLLPLGVCIYVLWSLRRTSDSDDALVEVLIEEVVADRPRIGLRDSTLPLPPPSPLIEAPPEAGHDAKDAAKPE